MSIAALKDGQRAKVRGKVVVHQIELDAPVSGRRCVVFEVRSGLTAEVAGERVDYGAVDFLLDDGEAQILVRPGDASRLSVESDPFEKATKGVDANLQLVAEALRDLKPQLQESAGPEHAALAEKAQKLKRVATLGYTLRAHARNKIHGNRFSSLAEQAAFLDSERATVREQIPQVDVPYLEGLIEVGDEVEVEGTCRLEMDSEGALYREVATRIVLVGTADEPLEITGEARDTPVETPGQKAKRKMRERKGQVVRAPKENEWSPAAKVVLRLLQLGIVGAVVLTAYKACSG